MTDGAPAAPEASLIAFRDLGGPHSDMEGRPHDMGFFHLLADARDSRGEIALIGRNLFGEGQQRPPIEDVIMFSEGLVAALERRGRGRQAPPAGSAAGRDGAAPCP